MRKTIVLLLFVIFVVSSNAQENKPLIHSGEIIDSALRLHENGKYKEALELYKKIRRGDTNYYRAVYETAFTLLADSQFAASKYTCEKGLEEPNEYWPDLMTLYANVIDDMGDPQRALHIYDSVIQMYPARTDPYLNKGTTLIRLEKYAEAEEVFKQALLINPYQASCHFKLGECARLQGKIIPSMLSYIYYLLLQPAGRYYKSCISLLSEISKATDSIRQLVDNRTDDAGNAFLSVERIILSKISLDKQYKPLLKLDDQITRQIQALLEKVEYDETEPDFCMQYYVPLYKKFFENGQFEPFVYRLFASVKIDVIQDYLKKKDKNISQIVDQTVVYCDQIRVTRELLFSKRKTMDPVYHFSNGLFTGKGSLKDNGEKITGYWEFYYSPGNLRSKGNYSESGKKTGLWEYYHFNGKLNGRQTFKDDELEGEEIFYYDNGNLSSVSHFKKGLEEGESKSYYYNGQLRSAAIYKDGKKNGERRSYLFTGRLSAVENYKEDSLHGPFKTFHENGLLQTEGSYVNGELSGVYKSYSVNGRLTLDGNYTSGKETGIWKAYYDNGKLKSQSNLADGILEGEYVQYYDNGQLYYKCLYKNGKLSGNIDYYDDDGKKFSTYSYDDDVLKMARFYDKTGKEISLSERKSKRMDMLSYYPDGFKRMLATYNDEGLVNGKEIFYYKSGKISNETTYEKGKIQGESTDYYPNGKKKATISYVNDQRHGYYKLWYQHGQINEEGWFLNGQVQGTWYTYDELGNVIYVNDYLNDDLNGYREEYFPNGKKESEFKYSTGWLDQYIQFDTTGKEINRCIFKNGTGKIRTVFFNGKVSAEGAYLNNKLDGQYRVYYFDGKLSSLQFYKTGYQDSIYKSYSHEGRVITEGQYKNGNKEGIWKTYYPNGKISIQEVYKDGELNGKKLYYYENGKLDSEMEFENNQRNGWTKRYDIDGSLIYQVKFKDDMPYAYTHQDKTGNLLTEILLPGNSGKVKTFYKNGNPSGEFEYIDGKLTGDNTFWHSNGKILSKSVEDYSLTEGSSRSYFFNGQLQYDYTYLHNNLHGPYKEYNEKGILIEEGYYYNGSPHDVIRIYDDNGKLKETRMYYYGILLDIKKQI